ncbi:MAG TPA: hypothetical protein PLU97_02955, partial [Candidatus Cryptobacteroides sp.]|nr:hypothetical protein [Candidatus Cryptobacteroides sp.]
GKGAVRQVDAWHGSPHTFDKFKSEKIGIGEGNQSFGWGLYFTDLEDVARHYAEKLGYGADIAINGKPIRKGENAFLAALSTDLAQATMLSSNTKAKQVAQIYIDSAIDRLENNLPYTGTKAEQAASLEYLKSMGRVESIEKKHSRNLYKVTLHKGKQLGEYNWLEWDKEVPDSIYKKMEDSISPIQEMKGRSHQLIDLLKWKISRKGPYSNKGSELYKELAKEYGSDKEASLFLLRAGIDGIKYPAGSLSGMKTDAFNYVVFDENAVTVEQHSVFEKEGEYGEDIEKEIAGIIETAKKNGTHLKAPNGKDTKLNPRQWAMVRTIRFKNWFGDWEKLEQKRLLSGEPIKVLTGKEFSKDENKDLLEQVSEWFKSKEVGGHAVSPFLGDVILDKEGIRATIAHGPLHRRKAIAFAAVPEIIRKGILLDYSENWKGRGYDTALLAAPVRMGSDDTVVFVVVKQAEKQKFHLEEVYTKKMLEEAYQKTGTRATSEVVGEPGTAPSFVLKIALPVFSVKGKDVSKVVDENGEPLVVYHATNKDFSEFSKDAIKSRFPYSFGFHFTDRIPEANQYTKGYGEGYLKGGNIMPVYLNAQRPLLINTSETSASMEADLNRAEIISKLYEAKKVSRLFPLCLNLPP